MNCVVRSVFQSPKVYVKPRRDQYKRNPIQQKIQEFKRFVENYRRHIICFLIVYGIIAGVIIERCYREWALCLFSPCVSLQTIFF